MTKKQIDAIKEIKNWTNTEFHGNRKNFNGLPVPLIKEIVLKKQLREIAANNYSINKFTRVRNLLEQSKQTTGTAYFKILIPGVNGIYYAPPIYGHKDYNKTRVLPNTPQNERIMYLFNSIINKYDFKKPQTTI